MTSSTPPPQRSATLNLPILEENPYAGHPELSSLEANVLWEYAKMAAMVKQLGTMTRNLANSPANELLSTMRVVESQMGLVLTLFKASVWSTIVTAEAEQGDNSDGNDSRHSGAGDVYGQRQPPSQEDESFYSDDVTPQPRYR